MFTRNCSAPRRLFLVVLPLLYALASSSGYAQSTSSGTTRTHGQKTITARAQIANLEKLLDSALLPVSVVFQSDNLTSVTLFRVAEMGRFEQRSLNLKPGRYVAGGTRAGFRDVRIEFSVTGEPVVEPIVVRCIEPI